MNPRVKILAFAGARDVLGAAEVELPLQSATTVADVMNRLCQKFPNLEAYRSSLRVAVNEHYAQPSDVVRAGDELALIPPVAGG